MAGGKTGAKLVGQELEKLRQQHQVLTPQIVLEAAMDEDSPLHRYFTWDDTTAAEKYRLQEAAKIIRSIEVVVVSKGGQETQHRALYTTVQIGQDEPGVYVTAEDGLTDKQIRVALLRRAKREAEIFIHKYQQLQSLARIMKTMKEAIEALQRAIDNDEDENEAAAD
jgi:hypothetical protein